MWISAVGTLIEYEGKTAGLGSFRDITKQKQIEEALRSSEERLKVLFEFAPDAHILYDLQGNIIDGNKMMEEIAGCSRDELIGRHFSELGLLPTEELLKAKESLGKRIKGQGTQMIEFTVSRRDGKQATVEARVFPVEINGK